MSNSNKTSDEFYVVGGTMQPDAPSYIERAADRELYERTLAGDFCYVLTPRQMGKSSLMARTAARLKNEGVCTAILDLTQIGTEQEKQSAGQWYYGIAYRVVKELGIAVNLSEWWEEREKLPALQRLTEFFGEVALAGTKGPVVIFVDEIDTTIGLRFSDDFFAAVRACYNARATQPEYRRLSFVLLGVATPSQLIKDARRTPFNIGHAIELTDFTYEEAQPLAQCLAADRGQGEEALKRILYWSGGHPYLTQKLCRLAAGEKPAVYGSEAIDGLVEKHFLALEAQRSDFNINFVRDWLVQKKKYKREVLTTYRRILKGRFIEDDPLSLTHAFLKLSGLVVPAEKRGLRVRNRIYQSIFTRDWVKEVMPIDWPRNISAALIVVLILCCAILYLLFLPGISIKGIRTAVDDVPIAEYNDLKSFPGYAGKADELFAEYWNRRALRAESREDRDRALIYRLKALTVKDTTTRRSESAHLLGSDYTNLVATYRHNGEVNAVSFSPDGKTILTGSRDGTARLWRSDNGQPLAEPMKHGDWVTAVSFSPDSQTVLTGSRDGTARLWRADTGQPMAEPIKVGSTVRAVSFSPDGKTVLTGSGDGTARLWRADNGQPMAEPMKHGDGVNAVSFSPDGKTLLTGSDDGTTRLWRSDNGQPLAEPMKHGRHVTAVSFSPDGKTVLTGSDDGTARLWRADNGQPMVEPMKHGHYVFAVSFSPDGKSVLTGSDDGTARLWRADTGQPMAEPMKHGRYVTAVSFSPDSKSVLTGSDDGTARLWRADNGQSLAEPMKYGRYVTAVSFSPDGQSVLTGSADGTARLWRADNGQPLAEPMKHGDRVTAVSFSPDGKSVLTGSDDGTARLWRADNGQPMAEPIKHGFWVLAVAFSPDGKTLLTGSANGTARLWRADNGQPLAEPINVGNFVLAVAFSPDGQTVLTGSANGTARLWRADNGQPLAEPIRPVGLLIAVLAVAFSPDGKTLLTGSSDGTARLWRTANGQPLAEPIKYLFSVTDLAFSPDGKTIMTGTAWWIHRSVVDGDKMISKANRLLPGRFTGGYRFLDEQGDKMQLAVLVTGDSIKIITVRFDSPDAPPIQGDPNELLAEWQKKLALELNEDGKIELMYPIVEERGEE